MTARRAVPLKHVVLDACDGPFGSSLKSDHYRDDGARVIRLGNVGVGSWVDSDAAYIDLDYWRLLNRHHALPGDLIVAGLGDENHPVGRACVLPDVGPAMVKADCYRLRLDPTRADARFVSLFLSSTAGSREASKLADGATRSRLTLSKALSIPIPNVDLARQRATVDYLDAETARIDAIVRSRRLQLQALDARRWSVVVHWTTGGRVSGDERVGLMSGFPAEWARTRLRFLVEPVQSGDWGGDPTGEDDVFVVRAADFDRHRLRVDPARLPLRQVDQASLQQRQLQSGDLVLEKSGGGPEQPVGAAVSFDLDIRAVPSNFAARLRPNDEVDSRFLCYVFAATYQVGLNQRSIKQTTGIQNLDVGAYLSESWAIPPYAEQVRLRARIDRELGEIGVLHDALGSQIDLLVERRQALITAAVTGQIEIPGVAA